MVVSSTDALVAALQEFIVRMPVGLCFRTRSLLSVQSLWSLSAVGASHLWRRRVISRAIIVAETS